MTIPKGIEECDLIAPSAAPGLTDAEVEALIADCRATAIPYEHPSRWHTQLRVLVQHCYAAGQAHPHGPPREPTDRMCVAGAHVLNGYLFSEDRGDLHAAADIFRAMYDASPAASQAAPAAVAEASSKDQRDADWEEVRGEAYEHAKAQEPDRIRGYQGSRDYSIKVLAKALGMEPDTVRAIEYYARQAAECIERLCEDVIRLTRNVQEHIDDKHRILRSYGAQHEADAAELKRQNEANDMLAEERDAFQARAATLQAQHEADAARMLELHGELDRAYEITEHAVALLRRALPCLDVRGTIYPAIRAFLAQADAHSDKGAG